VTDSGALKKPRLVVALYAPVTRDNSRHSPRRIFIQNSTKKLPVPYMAVVLVSDILRTYVIYNIIYHYYICHRIITISAPLQ